MLDRPVSALGAVSRRGVVLGGAVLVSGCDLDPRSDAPSTPVGATSGAPTDPSVEADLALLDDVRRAVRETRAQLSLVRRTHRSLRRPLARLGRLHRRHLRSLDGVGGSEETAVSPPLPPSADPGVALAEVRQAEISLQRLLGRSCVQAASGPFARMLASMSAGVAAHVAILREQP